MNIKCLDFIPFPGDLLNPRAEHSLLHCRQTLHFEPPGKPRRPNHQLINYKDFTQDDGGIRNVGNKNVGK